MDALLTVGLVCLTLICAAADEGPSVPLVPTSTMHAMAVKPAGERVYVKLFLRTVAMSLAITFSCFLLGYPIAYLLASLPLRSSNLLMILVLLVVSGDRDALLMRVPAPLRPILGSILRAAPPAGLSQRFEQG